MNQFAFSLLTLIFCSLAVASRDPDKVLQRPINETSSRVHVESAALVYEKGEAFCILSRSGGGDSGGGFRSNSVKNRDFTKPGEEIIGSGKEYPLPTDDEDMLLENQYLINFQITKHAEELIEYDPTFNVFEFLNCDFGVGIPMVAKNSLLFLLSDMREFAIEEGRDQDIKTLSRLINALSLYEDI